MKKLIKDFKQFLTEAQKSDYDSGGQLAIYHYAPVDTDQIIVDPKYFADRAKRSFGMWTQPSENNRYRQDGTYMLQLSPLLISMTLEMIRKDTKKCTATQSMDCARAKNGMKC